MMSSQASSKTFPGSGGPMREVTEDLKGKVGHAIDEGRSRVVDSAAAAVDRASKVMFDAGDEAARTARSVGRAVSSAAGDVADASSEYAAATAQGARTLTRELEDMVHRNPFAALAGTLAL